MACPRKYYFEHVVGWHPNLPDHHLWFGIAVHESLEYIYEQWRIEAPKTYSSDLMKAAFSVFLTKYREKYPEETDGEFSRYKTPIGFASILREYHSKYSISDNFDVIYTEVSGSVPVGETPDGKPLNFYFVLDTLCKDSSGYFILEHKTTQWSPKLWSETFDISIQVGAGNHVLHCLYGDETRGLIINGLVFKKDPEVIRLPKFMSGKAMEEWLFQVEDLFRQIHLDHERLSETKPTDTVMKAFPKKETGCMQFNRVCPFHSYCANCTNPLRDAETPPPDFTIEFWDPRVRERKPGALILGEKNET